MKLNNTCTLRTAAKLKHNSKIVQLYATYVEGINQDNRKGGGKVWRRRGWERVGAERGGRVRKVEGKGRYKEGD